MCARTLNYCEVKVPLIRPSTAGVPPRRGGGYYLFLPLGWPHGPHGPIGGRAKSDRGPKPGVEISIYQATSPCIINTASNLRD
jgi:hypothetical protein